MAIPRDRVAGKSATGTLTRPNVIVPVQKDRIPPGCSMSSSSAATSGSPLLHAGQARFEGAGQLVFLRLLWTEDLQLHLPAFRARLDQLHDASAVLVAIP